MHTTRHCVWAHCAHPSSLRFGSILFNIAIISYWISSNSSFNAIHIDSTSCNIYNIFNVELTITYTCSVYRTAYRDSYCSTMIMMKESVFVWWWTGGERARGFENANSTIATSFKCIWVAGSDTQHYMCSVHTRAYAWIEYTPKWIWLKRQPLIRNSKFV